MNKNNNLKGRLEVICGSMFSGKTEELIRRLKREEIAKKQVLALKHHLDKRYKNSPSNIISHQGTERFAFMVGGNSSELESIFDLISESTTTVGIDEIQFFSKEIVLIIMKLISYGKRIIVAGLDLDFRGEPFGVIPTLMTLADDVVKLKAICSSCGMDAQFTQRIINGEPASFDDPIIMVGSTEFYEARCRNCYKLKKGSSSQQSLYSY